MGLGLRVRSGYESVREAPTVCRRIWLKDSKNGGGGFLETKDCDIYWSLYWGPQFLETLSYGRLRPCLDAFGVAIVRLAGGLDYARCVVFQNRVTQYTPPKIIVHILGLPKRVPLELGNPHIGWFCVWSFREIGSRLRTLNPEPYRV